MVSEQTSENQESQRHQEPAGSAADGPGPIQPQYGHGYQGGRRTDDGRPSEYRQRAINIDGLSSNSKRF